jgi:hypothetical protein
MTKEEVASKLSQLYDNPSLGRKVLEHLLSVPAKTDEEGGIVSDPAGQAGMLFQVFMICESYKIPLHISSDTVGRWLAQVGGFRLEKFRAKPSDDLGRDAVACLITALNPPDNGVDGS